MIDIVVDQVGRLLLSAYIYKKTGGKEKRQEEKERRMTEHHGRFSADQIVFCINLIQSDTARTGIPG